MSAHVLLNLLYEYEVDTKSGHLTFDLSERTDNTEAVSPTKGITTYYPPPPPPPRRLTLVMKNIDKRSKYMIFSVSLLGSIGIRDLLYFGLSIIVTLQTSDHVFTYVIFMRYIYILSCSVLNTSCFCISTLKYFNTI